MAKASGQITLTEVFDGKDGVRGTDGKDGAVLYTWIKYADNSLGIGMSDNPEGKPYIGISYNNTNPTMSDNALDYQWSLIQGGQGIQGEKGENGETFFTWIRYADSETGEGFSDDPTGKEYLGISYNNLSSNESENPLDYAWTRIKGEAGYTPIKGVDYFDGIDGTDGKNGTSSYLWVRYSQNSNGSGMTTDPSGAKYVGIATTSTPTAPTSYSSYSWSLIRGNDGIDGEKGESGRTSYLHIKYSNDGGATFTPNNGEDVGDWIGTYVDFNSSDSTNISTYTWNKVKGEIGEKGDKGDRGERGERGYTGADGKTYYTWIRYADTPTSGLSTSPTGKEYIGISYNNLSATPSSVYADYDWALIKGQDGKDGINGRDGSDGENGTTYYTWIRYADDENGNGMSNISEGKRYLGIATNKTTSTESSNASDYTWSPLYDNVKVGGRNLVRNGDFSNGLEHWSTRGTGVTVDSTTLDYPILRLTNTGTDYIQAEQVIEVEPNTEYTLSFKNTRSAQVFMVEKQKGGGATSSYNDHGTDVNGNYTTFKKTIKTMSDTGQITLIFRSLAGNNPFFYEAQLEKGNVASDFAPNPDDVDAEIEKAKQEADQARQDAKNAQDTADGKNSVFYQPGQPSTAGKKTGDIWFDTDNDYRMYRFTGSAWSSTQFGNNAISELDAGKLNTGYLNAGRIASNSITTSHLNVTSLSAITANLGTVTAGNIKGVSIEGATITQTGTDGRSIVLDKTGLHVKDTTGKSRVSLLIEEVTGLHGDAVGLAFFDSQSDSVAMSMSTYYTDAEIWSDRGLRLVSQQLGVTVHTENALSDALTVTGGSFRVISGDLKAMRLTRNGYSEVSFRRSWGGFGIDVDGDNKFLLLPDGHIGIGWGALASYLPMLSVNGDGRFSGELQVDKDIHNPGLFRIIADSSTMTVRAETGNVYLQPGSGEEVRVTRPGTTSTYAPIRASSHYTSSSEKFKTNIEEFLRPALAIVNSSKVYQYNLKDEIENGIEKEKYGLIIERETPIEFIDGDGVEMYSILSIALKAIQELSDEVNALKERVSKN